MAHPPAGHRNGSTRRTLAGRACAAGFLSLLSLPLPGLPPDSPGAGAGDPPATAPSPAPGSSAPRRDRRPSGSPRATSQPTPPAGSPAPPGHEAGQVDLDDLLNRLGDRARAYETVALRFVCVETIHDTDDEKNDRRYDYMYVEEQPQRYKPYRQRHTGKPGPGTEVNLDLRFPDAYSWTLMFVRERQHLFKYRYAGDEWFSLRRAHVLAFDAPLPFTSGRMIYEWSGKVWVDAENNNILKVEATPGNQEDRMKRELAAYRKSPRFLAFSMGQKPEGARYTVTFLNEFHDLSLPDQADFLHFALDLDGLEEWGGQLSLRYNAYQFFNIDARDIMLKPAG